MNYNVFHISWNPNVWFGKLAKLANSLLPIIIEIWRTSIFVIFISLLFLIPDKAPDSHTIYPCEIPAELETGVRMSSCL